MPSTPELRPTPRERRQTSTCQHDRRRRRRRFRRVLGTNTVIGSIREGRKICSDSSLRRVQRRYWERNTDLPKQHTRTRFVRRFQIRRYNTTPPSGLWSFLSLITASRDERRQTSTRSTATAVRCQFDPGERETQKITSLNPSEETFSVDGSSCSNAHWEHRWGVRLANMLERPSRKFWRTKPRTACRLYRD